MSIAITDETVTLDAPRDDFQFECDAGRRFAAHAAPATAVLLEKWGVGVDKTVGQHYGFDGPTFRRGMADDFLAALFNSEAFRGNFQLLSGRGELSGMVGDRVAKVKYEALTCGETTLDMFDKAVNGDVVRESGHVCGMMDVYLPGGITVADQLRGAFMLGEESEHADLFDNSDKREFLYHVMHRLVAGGALCQWEDDFNVYKDVCRDMYRDMVAVGKNATTGDLEVQSVVYQVTAALQGDGAEAVPLFPRDDESGNFNYMYVAVHPLRRSCSVWYGAFTSSF
jgi:hypothetical protein